MATTFECASNDGSSVTFQGLSSSRLSIDSVDCDGSAETHISAESRHLVALAALPDVADAAYAATLAASTLTEEGLIKLAAAHLMAVSIRREKVVVDAALDARRDELAEQFTGVALFDGTTAGLQSAIDHIISLEAAE